jgi:hypothetical protein
MRIAVLFTAGGPAGRFAESGKGRDEKSALEVRQTLRTSASGGVKLWGDFGLQTSI